MSRMSWRASQIALVSIVLVACTDAPIPVAPTGARASLDQDDAAAGGPRGKWAIDVGTNAFNVADHVLTAKTEDFAVALRIKPLDQGTSELVVNIGATAAQGWDLVLLGPEWGTQSEHLGFYNNATNVIVDAPAAVSRGEWHDIVGGRRDGHWFIRLDHQDYDLGSSQPPQPIDDPTTGFSYVLNQFDGLVDYIAVRDLATHRTIERFSMEEGRDTVAAGQNGNRITFTQPVWVATHDAHDDNGGRDGRAIDACGTVIDARGTYTLTRDLVECPDFGIKVSASDVTIRLGGHIIDGTGSFTGNGSTGIEVGRGVTGGVKRVRLLGPGYVRDFAGGGVEFEQVANSQVTGLTIERNVFGVPLNAGYGANEPTHYSHDNLFDGNRVLFNVGHGFTVNGGTVNVLSRNDIEGNGDIGVFLYAGGSNVVRDNQIFANGTGIRVQANPDSRGHLITRNTVLRNFSIDMLDTWGDCTHDTWIQNVFGTASPSCIH